MANFKPIQLVQYYLDIMFQQLEKEQWNSSDPKTTRVGGIFLACSFIALWWKANKFHKKAFFFPLAPSILFQIFFNKLILTILNAALNHLNIFWRTNDITELEFNTFRKMFCPKILTEDEDNFQIKWNFKYLDCDIKRLTIVSIVYYLNIFAILYTLTIGF